VHDVLYTGLTQLGVSGVVIWFFVMWMKDKDKERESRLKETEDWIRNRMTEVITNNSTLIARLTEQLRSNHCPYDMENHHASYKDEKQGVGKDA
jgi:hypothetical protein